MKSRYLNITIDVGGTFESKILTHYIYCWGLFESMEFYIIIAVGGAFESKMLTHYSCCLGAPLQAEYSQIALWRSAAFGDFRKKNRLNARGFAREFLLSGMLYRPSKSLKKSGKSSSLHSKKIFLLGGCGFFVSDIISG